MCCISHRDGFSSSLSCHNVVSIATVAAAASCIQDFAAMNYMTKSINYNLRLNPESIARLGYT